MKQIKELCEEILKGIEIIESTQKDVDEMIALGVKMGASSQAISEGTQNGRYIILTSVETVKNNFNNLAPHIRSLLAVYRGTLNGKPQQYDSTTPQQDYEASEMDAIRANTKYDVSMVVTPAQEAA